jgi:Ca2+-binding RTX toxin-like protein
VLLDAAATSSAPQWDTAGTVVKADFLMSPITGIKSVTLLLAANVAMPADFKINGQALSTTTAIELLADANGLVRAPMTWTVAEDGTVIQAQTFQVQAVYHFSDGVTRDKATSVTFGYDDIRKSAQLQELDANGAVILKISAFGLSYDISGRDGVGDTINAGNGDDIVRGLGGNDLLSGGRGNDVLYGGDGGDTVSGDTGNDKLIGGAGADNLDGGAGTDTANYADSTAGVTVFLEATRQGQNAGGDALGDTLTGIENLVGSAFDDRLTGDADVNVLQGGDGSDTLEGRGGSDVLDGGVDSSTSFSNTASYSLSEAGVTASLLTPGGNTGDAQGDTYINIQNLTGSRFDDKLEGDRGINVLRGGDGSDVMDGGLGVTDYLVMRVMTF